LVKEQTPTDLSISQPLHGGGNFSIVCGETNLTFTGADAQGQSLRWAWDMIGGDQQKAVVQTVTSNGIAYRSNGMNYELRLSPNAGFSQQLSNGAIRLSPDNSGKLILVLGGF
jgi:hypothetical protein